MSSTYGESLHLSIFGQSHGAAIGMTLDGIPAGLPVDELKLNSFLSRRAPGRQAWATPRKEADCPQFLSGLKDGHTCGAPIAAVIFNQNTRSSDYTSIMDTPRPGHADYTAHIKYGGFEDSAGGGHFSGRLTAPLCIAGGLCKQWLEHMGINIHAHISSIGEVLDIPFDPMNPQANMDDPFFPTLDANTGKKMKELIACIKEKKDSVGGSIECAVTGLPAGLGEPIFGGLESRISQIIYGIPAVKSLSFGCTALYGSENNDPFCVENGHIRTSSNHCGGILGGISNGMPLIFKVGIKPTPSIGLQQNTVNLSSLENTAITISGRHDPCIVPRAVPVVEAATAIALYDLILSRSDRR